MSEIQQIGNFTIIKRIGRGSFGLVYEVLDITGEKLALKLESTPMKNTSQLKNEYDAYTELAGCRGILDVHYFGEYDNHFYLVMDLLGLSLQDLYEKENKYFSFKTTCMIGISVLESLEDIHGQYKIFRDIKPENILIGKKRPHELYLIDLGMAKNYKNPETKKHIPLVNNKKLTGTARYASLNTHLGYEQSRRDDLESLGYTLIYFLSTNLPWMGIKATNCREKHALIGQKKQNTKIETLCENIPSKQYFIKYFQYVRKLKFTEKPNYKYLINLFKRALRDRKLKYDLHYDWISAEDSKNLGRKKKKGFWKRMRDLMNVCKQ